MTGTNASKLAAWTRIFYQSDWLWKHHGALTAGAWCKPWPRPRQKCMPGTPGPQGQQTRMQCFHECWHSNANAAYRPAMLASAVTLLRGNAQRMGKTPSMAKLQPQQPPYPLCKPGMSGVRAAEQRQASDGSASLVAVLCRGTKPSSYPCEAGRSRQKHANQKDARALYGALSFALLCQSGLPAGVLRQIVP